MAPGKIILLNGASSAGKSTLARAVQERIAEPFWHISIDHFIEAGLPPMARVRAGDFSWRSLRPAFFDGFHRCLPALAGAGNNLIVEHIIETQAWRDTLTHLLHDFDVFFVGVHCPLPELERREQARGDRRLGDARRDFETIHALATYDLQVDGTLPAEHAAALLISAWQARTAHGAFAHLRDGRSAGPALRR